MTEKKAMAQESSEDFVKRMCEPQRNITILKAQNEMLEEARLECIERGDVDDGIISQIEDAKQDNLRLAMTQYGATPEDVENAQYHGASIKAIKAYENRLKNVPTDMLQRFFYNFWLRRNPSNPEEAWLNYKSRVEKVQSMFGSRQVKGYLTDRGRVYLQYGAPNDVKEVPSDPVTLPYEVWHYYYLNNQSNVKFVFYDPVLTGYDYELLHSSLYGEIQNPNWKMYLVRKIQTQQDIYDPNPVDYWGNEMDDYWRYH